MALEVKEVLFFSKEDEVRGPDPSNSVDNHFPHAVGKLSSSFLVKLAPYRDSLSRGMNKAVLKLAVGGPTVRWHYLHEIRAC